MKPVKITMSKADLLKEHKRLIKVLMKGDKKALMKEAKIQMKEIKGYKK
jgi:hypothetical protein